MVTKKDPSQTQEKRKKKGKSKRHLLTSMTYHIKEKHVCVDDDHEEPPEDGVEESDQLGEIKETIAEQQEQDCEENHH